MTKIEMRCAEHCGNHIDLTPYAVSVSTEGEGSLEHMIDTFQAFLVAAGFAPDTAARVGLQEEGE